MADLDVEVRPSPLALAQLLTAPIEGPTTAMAVRGPPIVGPTEGDGPIGLAEPVAVATVVIARTFAPARVRRRARVAPLGVAEQLAAGPEEGQTRP